MTSRNVTVAPQLSLAGRIVTVETRVSSISDNATALIFWGERTMLRIPRELVDKMLDHATQSPTVEVCGLVSTRRIYPIENVASHPQNNFTFDPVQFIKTFYHLQRSEEEAVVGIYHSHPNGPREPSPTDIQQAYYPEWVYFIVHHGRVSAWHIMNGETTLLNLQLIG